MMLEIDGSFGEGGGAVLRTALAYSMLTQKPFRITKIRANRKAPGLKAQHLCALTALAKCSGAKYSPVEIGSTELWFQPGEIKGGKYSIDIGTAGSITLVLQSLILPSLFAPSKISFEITGGTCGKWQASVDFLQQLLLPQLQRFATVKLTILSRGYYPKGGGKVLLEVSPRFKAKNYNNYLELLDALQHDVPTIQLVWQGLLEHIKGFCNLSRSLADENIGERIISSAKNYIQEQGIDVSVNIALQYAPSSCEGGELLLYSIHSNGEDANELTSGILSGDALFEISKYPEEVGKEAAKELLDALETNAAIDHFLADQLIPFMALLSGSKLMCSEITAHCISNMYVIEQFIDVNFTVNKSRKLLSVQANY